MGAIGNEREMSEAGRLRLWEGRQSCQIRQQSQQTVRSVSQPRASQSSQCMGFRDASYSAQVRADSSLCATWLPVTNINRTARAKLVMFRRQLMVLHVLRILLTSRLCASDLATSREQIDMRRKRDEGKTQGRLDIQAE